MTYPTAVLTYPLTVHDDGDHVGRLLDEADDLIAALDAALGDAAAAKLVIADGETEMLLIESSMMLETDGKNEGERKARLVIALHADAEYQTHAQAVRHARAGLLQAERTAEVARQRLRLVRAALAVVGGELSPR